MRSAAAVAAERGADLIDLNMGCPVPKVMKTGAGAALHQGSRHRGRGRARRARGLGPAGHGQAARGAQARRRRGLRGRAPARRGRRRRRSRRSTRAPRPCATRARPTTSSPRDLVAELPVPGDRLRRDGGRRAHPRRVRAHRLRGGDAGPRRARQPVAVRAGAGRPHERARVARRSLDEWQWVIDRAEEHLGPGPRRALSAQVPPLVHRAPGRGQGRAGTRSSGRTRSPSSAP